MGIRKRFNEAFGLEDGVDDERKRFVERVNQLIFHPIDTAVVGPFDYDERLCFLVYLEMGVNIYDLRWRDAGRPKRPPQIRVLTGDDFFKTLQVLCALYPYIKYQSDGKEGREWLSSNIELAISRCSRDIGVRWKDGSFYPAGAEELDKPLVEDTLTWLRDYASEEKDYRIALQGYVRGESLADVIKNCYSAVEGVARTILENQKTLDNNKDELLAKLHLSDGWKALLANYIKYAHEYRHASTERHEITSQEAEAYLYMTGLIIRLTIGSKDPAT